jgi:hypothetical protein
MTKTEGKPAIAAVKELFSTSPNGLREIVRAVVQEMLETEMTDALGAETGERTGARLGYRSGYYTRTLVTRVGKLELRVPQDRDGRFSTELFERYQRSEQALVATLAEMSRRGHRYGREPERKARIHSLLGGTIRLICVRENSERAVAAKPDATVLPRRHLLALHKAPVEPRYVIESNRKTDVGDWQLRVLEQVAGLSDPHLAQVVAEAATRDLPEEAAKRPRLHMDMLGGVLKRQILFQVLPHEGKNLINAYGGVVAEHGRVSLAA